MKENIRRILEAAVQAPSGDNCQPWRFQVAGDRIHIFNQPDKDTSLFNFRQRASLIAHGAAVENLLIAARALGYEADLALFPSPQNEHHLATVTLDESTERTETWFPQIPQRCTNRKAYDGSPLADAERSSLLELAVNSELGSLRLLEGSGKMALAQVICLNDRLVFENPHLHAFLFDHIRWNDREVQETCDGLDIKTLELSAPDAFAFRILRNWPLMNFLNTFGVARIVAASARKLAESSSALGVITIPGITATDYLNGGRLMERLWLDATRLGLSFQLMTGITFLMQRVQEGEEAGALSAEHASLIRSAHEKVAGLCTMPRETVAVIFRIGRSIPPSARSLRLPVEQLIRNSS